MGLVMKPLLQFGLCCLLAPGLFAQHHGGGTVGGGHPGGVMAGHHGGHGHASIRSFGRGRYGGYGYGYGGFFGGYYEPFEDYGYVAPAPESGSNVTVVYPPAPPAPVVTEIAHPVIHEYAQREDYGVPPDSETSPVLYLIAFRDNTIRAASTYWVQGATLHYLDQDHVEKQAPVSSIDRALSARLNRERHVPFNIP